MTTIYHVTKKLLELAELDFVRLENFGLFSVSLDEQYYSVPFPNAHKTLYELKIKSGSTLHFEPFFSEQRGRLLHSIIWGPRNNEKLDYEWNEATTTLGILHKDVVKAFHLESIEHEHIRLVTISDAEIDLIAYSHEKLSNLGLKNDSTIWIKLIDFRHNKNICVHIKCAYSDTTRLLHVSPTDTIARLNEKIESRLLIVHTLYTETNEKLDLNDCYRSLTELGVKSGQNIYANPQLRINTVYSSVVSQIPNEIRSLTPVTNHHKDQRLDQLELRSGTNIIDNAQPRRCLADFDIKQGSTIEAKMTKFNPIVSIYRKQYNVKNFFYSCGEVTGAYTELLFEFYSKNGHRSLSDIPVLASGRIEHLVKAFVDEHHRSDLFDRIIVQTIMMEESLDLNSPLYMLTDRKVKFIEQKERLIRTQPIQLEMNPKKITLYECLQEFISMEYLEDSWLCKQDICRRKTKAIKQLQLYTLPPVLIVQLKRFAYENGRQKKIKTFVEYPIEGLNLTDLSASQHAVYDLIAVSNHIGSTPNGHYTTYARQQTSTNLWYEFNDDIVSTIFSDSEIVTKNAYLLFYMKRNYQTRQNSQRYRESSV
ncbi:unnamed protein product [Rotaria sordida]|uniref:ubiquitinyl hydrolase 1 n=1 Tax=Rotaria sordida TaxID=392033 RepID=A0A818SMU2_9BILA|nr:unnamed protein product [Rotaria sordida]